MKKFLTPILAVLLTAACQQKYVDRYDSLAVDRTYLSVECTASTIPVMVYYSGPWTAVIASDCDWASLNRNSGDKIDAIYVTFQENTGVARETTLTLSNNKNESISIQINQKAGI